MQRNDQSLARKTCSVMAACTDPSLLVRCALYCRLSGVGLWLFPCQYYHVLAPHPPAMDSILSCTIGSVR